MQAAILSVFRSPQGMGALVAVLALAGGLFWLPSGGTSPTNGPAYDFIFGVHTFNPDAQSTSSLGPYVIDGTLYIQAEKLSAETSNGLKLYRYHSQTGVAEPLALPGPKELEHLEGQQRFTFGPTAQLKLLVADKSPDGYALAEPNWVKVDPISNVVGNIAMFLVSGGFGQIKKREQAPRLAKATASIAIQAKRPILENESDMAFLLGWIVPGYSDKAKGK